jgi:hypothetical protein
VVLAPAYAGDAVPGELTSGDTLFPNQGNGGYDVSHYDLDLTWNPGPPGGTIAATTTIQATTTGEPLSSFGLDLEGLAVTSVQVNGVAAATFSRIEEPDGAKPGKHKLVVTPATPVSGLFTVVVEYGGTPVTRHDTDGSDEGWIPTSDGATFMNQPIGSMTGFPNNDTPNDKATYSISVDVPAGLEVVSNGEPTLPLPDGSGTRSHWQWTETQPMASELVLVSIGQYQVLTSGVGLIDRCVPEWSFVDSAIYGVNHVAINAGRAQLSSILTSLEARLGPYPGKSTGIVVDSTGVGYALETQDRPSFPSSNGVGGTLVHELTHQWYGDSVSPTVWNDLWINEGMATWAPIDVSGASTYTQFHGEWENTPADSALWQTPPAGITDPSDLFGWQSYDRGAMTYEALRTLIGDSEFRTLIKQWQLLNHGGSHGAADLQALAEQISGLDLDGFFQDWIHDADKPAWPNASPPTATPPAATPHDCTTGTGPQPPVPPTRPGTIGAGCGVHVTGAARVGHTLKAKVRGCPAGATYSYRWLAGGTKVTGATHPMYRIKPGELGERLKVKVTVRATGYLDAVRVSKATRKVR